MSIPSSSTAPDKKENLCVRNEREIENQFICIYINIIYKYLFLPEVQS